MDIDGKNSRVVAAGFDRDIADPRGRPTAATSTSPMTNAACETGLHHARRQGAHAGGRAGRNGPRASVYLGRFSVARNGAWRSLTTRRRGRPMWRIVRIRVGPARRAHRAQRRPAGEQDAGRGEGDHLEVLEGPARDPGLGRHAAGLRRREEISADPRDPRRAVRRLRPDFTAEMQLFAAAGYVVLYANPRGSTSYGDEFGNLIHHDYPGHDYDDLMSGVDAVIAQGHVDPTTCSSPAAAAAACSRPGSSARPTASAPRWSPSP